MKNKKQVTVWGGSGFIGSHVCDEFSKRGVNVIVADKKKSNWINQNQKMYVGDITNLNDVDKSIKGSSIVLNFAGISDIDIANKDPLGSINQNILGNMNILKSCSQNSVKKYIFASTIYVFSDSGGFYRCSKQSAELFIKEFCKKNSLKYNILRFGTVYGTRASDKNSVHRYIKLALNNKKINVPASGDILREYIHVSDISTICFNITKSKNNNCCYIITGNNNYKLKNLFKIISEITKRKIRVNYVKNSKNSHYTISPYSYEPEQSKKITNNVYTDLGQGILEIIKEIKS